MLVYQRCCGIRDDSIIIVSAIICNYLLGASLSLLEIIINSLGVILFIAVAGVCAEYTGKQTRA